MCQIYHILDEFFIGLLLLPVALMETFHDYLYPSPFSSSTKEMLWWYRRQRDEKHTHG